MSVEQILKAKSIEFQVKIVTPIINFIMVLMAMMLNNHITIFPATSKINNDNTKLNSIVNYYISKGTTEVEDL